MQIRKVSLSEIRINGIWLFYNFVNNRIEFSEFYFISSFEDDLLNVM